MAEKVAEAGKEEQRKFPAMVGLLVVGKDDEGKDSDVVGRAIVETIPL